MLFILTGDIQTGKTRWLLSLIDDLQSHGVTVYGVTAPGLWVEPLDPGKAVMCSDGIAREKTGIDNVLWPQGERIPFARRSDLADGGASHRQSSEAKLGWAIDDGAIDRVNAHFEGIARDWQAAPPPGPAAARALLVVDELGRLELLCGTGLTAAMNLLAKGPEPACGTALVIVREQLAETALERFALTWDEVEMIGPTDEAAAKVIDGIYAGWRKEAGAVGPSFE